VLATRIRRLMLLLARPRETDAVRRPCLWVLTLEAVFGTETGTGWSGVNSTNG
jgi:hypothetical protein